MARWWKSCIWFAIFLLLARSARNWALLTTNTPIDIQAATSIAIDTVADTVLSPSPSVRKHAIDLEVMRPSLPPTQALREASDFVSKQTSFFPKSSRNDNPASGKYATTQAHEPLLLEPRQETNNSVIFNSAVSIVTAADSGHFLALVGALWALRRTESVSTRVLIYDLGLSPCQRSYLEDLARCLAGLNIVRSFPYAKYPAYFNISNHAGSYAWKPAIVHDVLKGEKEGAIVVWLDAGTEMGRRIENILADSRSFGSNGFISSVTTGTLHQWTHIGMLDWFESEQGGGMGNKVRVMINRERWSNPCNGAFLGFRKGSYAESAVVPSWYKCALDLDCIAPQGSSRRNHRQDQSALTVLTKVELEAGGCAPLRSEGTMRFWRDSYFEVNAPVLFAFSKRMCSGVKKKSKPASLGVVCPKASPPPRSTMSLLLVLTKTVRTAPDDEEPLLQAIASARQHFWRERGQTASNGEMIEEGGLHVVLCLAPGAGSGRLHRVEAAIGTDSFVSVLKGAAALRVALQGHTFLVLAFPEDLFGKTHLGLGCLSASTSLALSAECLRDVRDRGEHGGGQVWEIPLGNCAPLYVSTSARPIVALVEEYIASGTNALATAKMGAVGVCGAVTKSSLTGPQSTIGVQSEHKPERPLLVTEAAAGDKAGAKKIRQLKKQLPSKGVVLGLFAKTQGERSALALAAVFMGALGFGLRWSSADGRDVLVMQELERLDLLLANGSTAEGSLASFTRKSKKEVRHAPWVMVSALLEGTFPFWREHLEQVVCVVLASNASEVQWASGVVESPSCSDGVPSVLVQGISDWSLYSMFQQLKTIVGNVRALTRAEVSLLVTVANGESRGGGFVYA